MRPIANQVVVITGASSGIGRQTAIEFAKLNARVVLAARCEPSLHEVASDVRNFNGIAEVIPTDIGDWAQVRELARKTVERFGRIDTWVNNAAVSTYVKVQDLEIEEIEQVIRTSLLGQIYGMKAVLPYMINQEQGCIINVASVAAERAIPLQAPYCAAKHGLRGFTEALRLELIQDHPGIQVTLVLPASINTPFFNHARSKKGAHPRPLPPVYDARGVAEAIIDAAKHPVRDVYVGTSSKLISIMQKISPNLLDYYMVSKNRGVKQQLTDKDTVLDDSLFETSYGTHTVSGDFSSEVKRTRIFKRPYRFTSTSADTPTNLS